MNIYIDLFVTFAKIGAMTFGGGAAMLPVLEREIVENKGWAEESDLMDYYAIGQCTPGIIAVNTATFIGRKRAGNRGGVAATLGMVFPSLVIITLLAALISNFSDVEWVKNAFAGIRVCVCVLMTKAVIRLSKAAIIDAFTMAIFLIVLAFAVFTDLSPVVFVVLAAFAGIIMQVKKK